MSSTDPENGADGEKAPLDVDSAFAAIVAQWGSESPAGSWPSVEDLSPGDGEEPTDPPAEAPEPEPVAPIGLTTVGPRDVPLTPARAEAAEEESFVPPDPPPLPRGDAFTMLAWAGVLLGPVFLLVCVIVWKTAPQMYILAAVVAFIGGFVTLVSRMPKHRDDDDDDGAVV